MFFLLTSFYIYCKLSQLAEAQLAAELEHEEALRRGVKQRRRSSIRSPTSLSSPNSSEPSSAKRRGSVLSPGGSGGSRWESLSPLGGSSREPLSPSSPLKGLQEEVAEAAATPLSSSPRGRPSAPKVLRSASERAAGLPVALLRQESTASSGGAGISPTRGSAAAMHRGSSSSRDRRGSPSPSKQNRGSLSPSSSSLSPLRRRNTIANSSPSPSRRGRVGSGPRKNLGASSAAAKGSRRWSGRAGLRDDDEDDNASAEEMDDESDASDEEMAWDRTRIWGAWEAVHPAALGRKSQREAFPWKDPIRFEGGTGDDKKKSSSSYCSKCIIIALSLWSYLSRQLLEYTQRDTKFDSAAECLL